MKNVPALVKLFQESGFTLVRATNHQIWRCPCGHAQITSSTSQHGGRGDQNCRALIRRTLRNCNRQKETP